MPIIKHYYPTRFHFHKVFGGLGPRLGSHYYRDLLTQWYLSTRGPVKVKVGRYELKLFWFKNWEFGPPAKGAWGGNGSPAKAFRFSLSQVWGAPGENSLNCEEELEFERIQLWSFKHCHILYPAYPVDTVGVANSWDCFGLRVGLLDGNSTERRAAGAHAAVCTAALIILIRRASRLDLQASPLHSIVDAARKFPIATTTAIHQRDRKRSAVFPVPAKMTVTEPTKEINNPASQVSGWPARHLSRIHPNCHLLGKTQIFIAHWTLLAGLLEDRVLQPDPVHAQTPETVQNTERLQRHTSGLLVKAPCHPGNPESSLKAIQIILNST